MTCPRILGLSEADVDAIRALGPYYGGDIWQSTRPEGWGLAEIAAVEAAR